MPPVLPSGGLSLEQSRCRKTALAYALRGGSCLPAAVRALHYQTLEVRMRFVAMVLAIGFFSSTGVVHAAGNAPKTEKTDVAADLHRSCTGSYSVCVASCGPSAKRECVSECADDCEVCALDFGEEPAESCRR